MNFVAFRHPLLIALAAEIGTSSVLEHPTYAPTAELWHATGVFATDDALALTDSDAARSGDLGILTRHARPLSWLFFALRVDSRLTGGPGAECIFFGRLADAANAYLAAHQPEEEDWRPLLLTVLQEAGEILRERYAHLDALRPAARVANPSRPRVRRARRAAYPAVGHELVAA